ncbi:MAG TPA: hypothetical protein VGF71_04300 [Caulobacteraceae bacterium]|jgi:hypothetical protein
MTRPRAVRLLMLAGGCAAAALCATPLAIARPRPQPVVEAPPPPPPPAGPVALPARTLADAAAFQAYIERAGAVSPAFANGLSVADALKHVTANSPQALIRDAVAYGAVAALQDPTFVAAVRAAGTSPENRRLMAGYLINDARYALLFKGSDRAAGLAQQAIGQAGLKLVVTGRQIRQASYDIQHQAWSKEEVANRPDRLRMVESQGEQSLPDASDHVDALQRETVGAQTMGISAGAIPPPYSPLVAEAVQLAAIAALGEASDDLYERLAALAGDQYGADACLHEAKLNLYQCLAVAKPHYEDMYCMGQHGMNDAGVCLVTAAGLDAPPEPPPPAPPPRISSKRVAKIAERSDMKTSGKPATPPAAKVAERPTATRVATRPVTPGVTPPAAVMRTPGAAPAISVAETAAASPVSGPIADPAANLRANLAAGRIAEPISDLTTNPVNTPSAYPPAPPNPPADSEVVPTASPGG